MIDSVRQDILCKLRELSEAAPELRFGQMIATLSFLEAGPWDRTLWDLEDEQLLAAIEQHLADVEARTRVSVN